MFMADDFGLGAEVNDAIVQAYREGALTGAGLMIGQPGTAEAVELARRNPELELGWHVHLCDSRPVTRERWPWGNSPMQAGLQLGWGRSNRSLIAAEIQEQWRRFKATGLPCRFVNSHHHLHFHPWVRRVLAEVLASEPVGWQRGLRFRLFGGARDWRSALTRAAAGYRFISPAGPAWPAADSVWGIDRFRCMNAAEIRAVLATLPEGRHEFIFHPRTRVADQDFEALRTLGPTVKTAGLAAV